MLSHRFEHRISKQESIALSYIRMVSCFMIITCHFLQAYENEWAYILNTGVQIFLLLSGYIYGAKGIKSVKSFYIGRIVKVYNPYVIWTLLIAIMMLLISPEHIGIRGVLAQLLMIGTIDGQSHLWFLPILFRCYLILPIFELIKRTTTAFCALVAFITILTAEFFETNDANLLWVVTYYIGYMLGRWPNLIKILAIPISLVFAAILIHSSNIIIDFQDRFILGRGLHILLAVLFLLCFLILPQLLRRCNILRTNKLPPPNRNVGNHEYVIYLVHQTYILGPLSVIGVFGNSLDIIIAIILIICSAAFLIKVEHLFDKLLNYVQIHIFGKTKSQ